MTHRGASREELARTQEVAGVVLWCQTQGEEGALCGSETRGDTRRKGRKNLAWDQMGRAKPTDGL